MNTIKVKNIAELKTRKGISESTVEVLGYYTEGDGGGGNFYWDNTSTETDNGGTIVSVSTVGTGRWKREINNNIDIKWFGAKGDGVTDDLNLIQKAVDYASLVGVNLIITKGTYLVSNSILIYANTVIIGTSRIDCIFINTNNSNYLFKYHSAILTSNYDIDSSLRISDIKLTSKYGINLNQEGDFSTIFNLQAAIKGIKIERCSFIGTHVSTADSNSTTNIFPSKNSLIAFGVGIFFNKVFNSIIENNIFQNYGIAGYFNGCDINYINTNRFVTNSRHFHFQTTTTNNYGYQNKFTNNDVLDNLRVGAVYNDCFFTTINDNYFETYSNAAKYIYCEKDGGTNICNNRFDGSSTNTPIMTLSPKYGCLVYGNRLNPSLVESSIEVLPTNYSVSVDSVGATYLVKFATNSNSLKIPKIPHCEYDSNNIRIWNESNPKALQGVLASSYPFEKISGIWQTKSNTDILLVFFETLSTDEKLMVSFSGKYVSGGGYTVIKWGGVNAFAGSLGLLNNANNQVVNVLITKPVSVTNSSGLSIELVTTEVTYNTISIEPYVTTYLT